MGASERGPRDGESAANRFRLLELNGREKLRFDLDRRLPPLAETSELSEGDLACGTTKGERGDWGVETPLLDESFRGWEKVDPAKELA